MVSISWQWFLTLSGEEQGLGARRGMVAYAPENLMKAVTPLHMHTLQFANNCKACRDISPVSRLRIHILWAKLPSHKLSSHMGC